MPSGSFKQVDVKCPFYKYDDGKRRVTCEGITDESSLALIFRKNGDFNIQIDEYCSRHYRCCEIYQMLIKKYEEEDE